jgi:hypothetical protein
MGVDGSGWEWMGVDGAGEGNRTPDLLLTMEALCRLSYSGGAAMIATGSRAGEDTRAAERSPAETTHHALAGAEPSAPEPSGPRYFRTAEMTGRASQ